MFERVTVVPYRKKKFFPNGYGVSIIRNPMSYGGEQGLFEVAVLNSAGELVYDTPITNDVIGWLTPREVVQVIQYVRALPARK